MAAVRGLRGPRQKQVRLRFRRDFNACHLSLPRPPTSCPALPLDGPSTTSETEAAGVRQLGGSPLRAGAGRRESGRASEWRHATPPFPVAPRPVFREALCKQLGNSARTPLLGGCCPQVSHVEIPEPKLTSQLLPSRLPLMRQGQGDMALGQTNRSGLSAKWTRTPGNWLLGADAPEGLMGPPPARGSHPPKHTHTHGLGWLSKRKTGRLPPQPSIRTGPSSGKQAKVRPQARA